MQRKNEDIVVDFFLSISLPDGSKLVTPIQFYVCFISLNSQKLRGPNTLVMP